MCRSLVVLLALSLAGCDDKAASTPPGSSVPTKWAPGLGTVKGPNGQMQWVPTPADPNRPRPNPAPPQGGDEKQPPEGG